MLLMLSSSTLARSAHGYFLLPPGTWLREISFKRLSQQLHVSKKSLGQHMVMHLKMELLTEPTPRHTPCWQKKKTQARGTLVLPPGLVTRLTLDTRKKEF